MLRTDVPDLNQLIQNGKQSTDFRSSVISLPNHHLILSYYSTLINEKNLHQFLIHPLQNSGLETVIEKIDDIRKVVPIDDIEITDKVDIIQEKLFKGYVIAQLNEDEQRVALIKVSDKQGLRKSNDTENEFSVVGPKVGFVEDIDTNLHLLRTQINIPNLIIKEIKVGSVSKTRVAIVYIDGVANAQNINTVEQRLNDLDYDVILDSSVLEQVISDNTRTPFPLFMSTERRDKLVYGLVRGQVAVISDGSPYFYTGPSHLFDFFISPEDYYLPWILGSFIRGIRICGIIFSLFATSFYIAVTTYHYEVIPRAHLGPLIFSRLNVPFPPVLEVLFLEMSIEFLREAGARLPTKIGQTLGIVGAIIVGQAAVQAALTSNILIVMVSLAALASFATPIYKMSNTIRFLRFPIILLAASWGGLGISIGICFFIAHLVRLQSLGYPYLVPLFPLRVKELADTLIRPPFQFSDKRPLYTRPLSLLKFSPKSVKKKKQLDHE